MWRFRVRDPLGSDTPGVGRETPWLILINNPLVDFNKLAGESPSFLRTGEAGFSSHLTSSVLVAVYTQGRALVEIYTDFTQGRELVEIFTGGFSSHLTSPAQCLTHYSYLSESLPG
jgi:hypothetical protein